MMFFTPKSDAAPMSMFGALTSHLLQEEVGEYLLQLLADAINVVQVDAIHISPAWASSYSQPSSVGLPRLCGLIIRPHHRFGTRRSCQGRFIGCPRGYAISRTLPN